MNKRFLLAAVNAKYVHASLALYLLRDYAEEAKDRIDLAEYTINMLPGDIIEDIYRKKPGFLAFSCYIWNIDLILDICSTLRKVLPDTAIWLGGPEVSSESEEILAANPQITGIMQGEGEKVFRALSKAYADAWEQGEDTGISNEVLADIPRILWRDEKEGIRSGRTATEADEISMDEVPFVYGDMEPFQNKIIYYETSRGCPFHCSYCLSSLEKTTRFRSMDLVLKELQYFLDLKVPQVKFVDRTFNCRSERTLQIWRYIAEHDNGVTNFHFELEPNLLTEEELDLLCSLRPGLVQTEIGVQSTHADTLKAVHRNPDLRHIRGAAERIIEAGNLHLHLDLIAGLPYEDLESFRHSFNEVYELRPNELQLGFLKLLRGTLIKSEAKQYGIICADKAPYEVLQTNWLSYDDILLLKDVEEMLEVYSNSQQYKRTIRELEKYFADPFEMFRELAVYHRQKGLFMMSLSRMQRVETLRNFVRAKVQDETEQARFDDLLLYDLYARENAKSRPAWAPDTAKGSELWAAKREFYGQEARESRYLPALAGRSPQDLSRMTHLEYLASEDSWLLFDYSERSEITGDARIIRVDCIS